MFQLREWALAKCAEETGYPPDEVVRKGMHAFMSLRNNVDEYIFEDVVPTLERLQRQGYVIGSITNGNASLAGTKLEAYFQFEITAHMAGCFKPDQKIFDLAWKECYTRGVKAPECVVYVGDSYDGDVLGAKTAGWRGVWVSPHGASEGFDRADAVIRNISGLVSVLDTWNSKTCIDCPKVHTNQRIEQKL